MKNKINLNRINSLHRRDFCFINDMKYTILFLTLFSFIACRDNKREAVVKTDTASKRAPSSVKSFSDSFDSLNRDSLLVYPRMSSNAADEPSYPFSGKPLKDFDVREVDTSRFEHPVKRKMSFFATNKIPLGKDHTGLLLRTPSIYWESAIYLLLWDNTLNKVTDQLEIAEWWGDAGDLVFVQSWLLDLKKDNPKILVVKNITKPKDLNKPSITVTTDTVYRYIIKDNHFILETKAETDRDYLRRKYNIILRNITSG